MIAAHAVHGKLELPRVVETLSTEYGSVVLPLNYGSVYSGVGRRAFDGSSTPDGNLSTVGFPLFHRSALRLIPPLLVGSAYTVIVATSVSLSPPCNVTTDGTA